MTRITTLLFCAAMVCAGPLAAQPKPFLEHNNLMDHGDGHLMDWDGGMVMGQNKDRLPDGCSRIAADAEITVRAGRKYSKPYPGTVFGFDEHQWKFEPCTRLTVHFINEDTVRHQWMMHGLPKYMYAQGMFHLELTGRGKISGTLILPAEDKTYLVHCDIAQHMEKGMKGQLVVGKGSGDLPSIPGVTNLAVPDDYTLTIQTAYAKPGPAAPAPVATPGGPVAPAPAPSTSLFSGMLAIGLALGLFGTPLAARAVGTETGRRRIRSAACLVWGGINRLIAWLHGLITRTDRDRLEKKS